MFHEALSRRDLKSCNCRGDVLCDSSIVRERAYIQDIYQATAAPQKLLQLDIHCKYWQTTCKNVLQDRTGLQYASSNAQEDRSPSMCRDIKHLICNFSASLKVMSCSITSKNFPSKESTCNLCAEGT